MASNGPYKSLIPSTLSVSTTRDGEAGAKTAASAVSHGERPTLRREWRAFIFYLGVMDILTILFSLWLAYSLRITSGLLDYYGPENLEAYRALSLYSLPAWFALFAFFGLYQRDNLLGGTKEYQLLFKACTSGVIAIVLLSFLWRDQFALVSRGWLMTAWALSIALLLFQRFLSRRIGYGLRRRGRLTNRVLLVGANDQGLAMVQQWTSSPSSGIEVVGFLDDFKAYGTEIGGGVKVLGRPRNLHELVGQYNVDEVVVVPNAIAWETFEEIIVNGNCDGNYTMRLSPGFYEIMSTSVAVTNRQFVPLLTVNDQRLVGIDAIIKAGLDYGLGVPLLVLTLPFLGLTALILKLQDRQLPVCDRHPVLLPNGAVLNMLRFRTRNSDGVPSPYGALLEQTEFDRAPQILHVVAGQMSLVGPRAQPAGLDSHAERTERNQRTLKPGVIGPWSVWNQWMQDDEHGFDTYYIRNWTLWLDLQIVFQTAVVLTRRTWHWLRQSNHIAR